MSARKQQFSRQELLAAVDKGWKHYLSQLQELSVEEQARYAQAQGFPRIQDVLVHIFGWWELSMQRSLQVLSGHSVPIEDDMDEFNVEVVARYQDWTSEAVEAKFASTLIVFEHFLIDLPEKAFEHEHIQLWLRIDAIDHYEAHHLPNASSLQEPSLE